LTLSHFSPDAVVAELRLLESQRFDAHDLPAITEVADEAFVRRELLPRLADASEPLRSNLVDVLRQTGNRHRQRYVDTSGGSVG
jgi:hypothetical protein